MGKELHERAQAMEWRPRGLFQKAHPEHGATVDDTNVEDMEPSIVDKNGVTPYETMCELFKNVSVVIGMHPDQAAGAIVEFGVAHRRPYALVPCCTFAKEFPRRRLKTGQSVGSYEDLIQWLLELDPGASLDHLDFEGRNIVIYNRFVGPHA